MQTKFPDVPLLSYTYKQEHAQTYRERRLAESYTLTHCAMSGLPLGYFPTRKIAYTAAIPFTQLSMADVRAAITTAVKSPSDCQSRTYAFFALLAKVPAPLLTFKTLQLRPAWQDSRLKSMRSDAGLRNFTSFIESVLTLPERWYAEFPAHIITRDLNVDNTDLRDFPLVLARWIAIIESTKSRQKIHKYELPKSLNIFRRGRNAPGNPFAPTKQNSSEITEYARTLAEFYQRPYNLKWDDFVRNPSQLSAQKLRLLLRNIVAINVQECDDDWTEALELSRHFQRWVEEHLLRVEQQEEHAAKMHRMISNDTLLLLSNVTEVNLTELVAKSDAIDIANNKPQRDSFQTFEQFTDALSRWRKSSANPASSSAQKRAALLASVRTNGS